MPKTSGGVHCPNCGYRLPKTTNDLRRLEEENKRLNEELAELEELLSHMQIHTYFATPVGDCFNRRECKWIREIPDRKLIEFISHEIAVTHKKPCKTCRS